MTFNPSDREQAVFLVRLGASHKLEGPYSWTILDSEEGVELARSDRFVACAPDGSAHVAELDSLRWVVMLLGVDDEVCQFLRFDGPSPDKAWALWEKEQLSGPGTPQAPAETDRSSKGRGL